MSAAKSPNENNIDFNEMDFPELGVKDVRPGKGRERRHAAEVRAHRQMLTRTLLTKTVDDPDNLLGKRRKARLVSECSDSLSFDVPYSMNRKGRWETEARDLLGGEHPVGADVDVIEKACTLRGNQVQATAVHCLNDDGSISTATPNGYSASADSLRKNASKKRREGRRSARNSQNDHALDEVASESELEESPSAVRVCYTVHKAHANPTAATKKPGKKGVTKEKTLRRAGAFQLFADDLESASEMEHSMHEYDPNAYKHSRDFRFCLADYMEKPTVPPMEYVRRTSVEEKKNTIRGTSALLEEDIVRIDHAEQENISPITHVDLAPKTDAFFDSLLLSTNEWHGFSFVEQVDELADSLIVRWLDADRRRAAIDASQLLLSDHEVHDRQLLVVVLEKMRKNNMRVIVNTVFSASPDFSLAIIGEKVNAIGGRSLRIIIEAVVAEVKQWKTERPLTFETEPNSRFDTHRELFGSTVNCRLLANQANVISMNKMAELLRKETEFAVDTFERLSSENWSSCDEELDLEMVGHAPNSVAASVKCGICSSDDIDELFDMDDCWQCRQCLRQIIVSKIRAKDVPVHLPFVCMEGQSPYDVLPALVPLPLIHFYTRMAATVIMSESTEEIGDLRDCPSCRQLTHVFRPNEFGACWCSSCGVHWCATCNSEPHWPMTCDEHAQWTQKFDKQYANELMRSKVDKHTLRIICECGETIVCGDKETRAECRHCCLEFDPQTMLLLKVTFPYHPKARKEQIATKATPFRYKSIETVPLPQLINKQTAEMCAAARTDRLSEAKLNDFERKVRKIKEHTNNADKLKELRKGVLCLVENGNAWIYMKRAQKSNINGVKTALNAVQKQLDELICDMENNGKTSLDVKIQALQAGLQKAIETIRKVLDN